MNLIQAITRLNAVGYETFQKSRTVVMNQIRDILRRINEDIPFDKVEDKKDTKKFDKKYADSKLLPLAYELIKQGKIPPEEGKLIEDFFNDTLELIKPLEKKYKKEMSKLIVYEPVFIEFLDKIRGIDKVLSARLIAKLGDCHKFDNVAKLWSYCGLSVVDGVAVKRKKGVQSKWSSKLKSITWLISEGLTIHNKGYYRQVFDDDKNKQENREFPVGYLHEKYPNKSKDNGNAIYPESAIKLKKNHINNRSKRKMRKIFLSHFWSASRELAGLPTRNLYVEEYLGHTHIISWKEALEKENTYTPKLVPKKPKKDKK